mmetsp:Transcript_26083/g.84219  ORF Transcript_26083/g.84219 Transcript_26083/m.84219 type:complete len:233 (-) Transcript_26083:4323-5021(-)
MPSARLPHRATGTPLLQHETPVEPGSLKDFVAVEVKLRVLESYHKGREIVADPIVAQGALLVATDVNGRMAKVDVDAHFLFCLALERLERGLAGVNVAPRGRPAAARSHQQHARTVGGEENAGGTLGGRGARWHDTGQLGPGARPPIVDELGWLKRVVRADMLRRRRLIYRLNVPRLAVVVEGEARLREPHEIDTLQGRLGDAEPYGGGFGAAVDSLALLLDGPLGARLERV